MLSELRLNRIPVLRVFNKEDKLDPKEVEVIRRKYDGVSISALQPHSLGGFFLAIERRLWEEGSSTDKMSQVRLTNQGSSDI